MIFLSLLLGHLIADFLLQPNRLILWKKKSWVGIAFHAFIHFCIESIILAPYLSQKWVIITLIGINISHFIIDYIKIALEKKRFYFVRFFLYDQIVHIAILFFISFFISGFDFQARDLTLGCFFVYFILFIIFTLGIDIMKFQFVLEQNRFMQYQAHIKSMGKRFILFSFIYGMVLLGIFLLK